MSAETKKVLFIFDFDDTLADCCTVYTIANNLQGLENGKKFKEIVIKVSFYEAFKFLLDKRNAISKDMDNFNKVICDFPFVNGVVDLLHYLKNLKTKDNFDVVINTGNCDYIVKKNIERIDCGGLINLILHITPFRL